MTTSVPLPTSPLATPATPAPDVPRPAADRWRHRLVPGVAAVLVALVLLVSPLVAGSRIVRDAAGAGPRDVPYDWALLAGTRWWDGPLLRPWGLLSAVAVVAAILLARRAPRTATVLVLAPFAAVPLWATFALGWWAALLVVGCLLLDRSWRLALVPLTASVVVAWVYALAGIPAATPAGQIYAGVYDHSGWQWEAAGIFTVAVLLTAGVGLGRRALDRLQRREEDAVAARQHAEDDAAAATERARLARDLHDVVAHHVSLVAVRAEAAPFQHPDLPETARAVLRDIATDARSALDELRHVLAVLRRNDADADRAPQPGACDVVALVDQARAAGQTVDLTGACDGVPAAQGYALYRSVQEALTNARRHAPGQPVDVTLTHRTGQVGVRVVNPVPASTAAAASRRGTGRGLAGMRERAEALGGIVLDAVEDGAFVLVVTLPVTEGTESAGVAGAPERASAADASSRVAP
ncbi:sensor histidine kinase [Luteimicrobium subarcticum]|uniref:histidine kinase n=1 Tax=Luteimicrobium subarcticum TaxID=620910 RepID=A0A2M8WSV6_9MICO|nr:histidine kinase [Luteimicrobium subarcticum]PJI94031.1 signal transduction histidine kinase [Luteimicrobium subarcticum]